MGTRYLEGTPAMRVPHLRDLRQHGRRGRGSVNSLVLTRAARAAIGAVAVRGLGLPAIRVARALGVTPMPLLRGIQRGGMLFQTRKLDMEELAGETQKG